MEENVPPSYGTEKRVITAKLQALQLPIPPFWLFAQVGGFNI